MITWIHLALRFIEYMNLCCIEMLINSLCLVLSFDVTQDGALQLFCWCTGKREERHGFGRNVRHRRRGRDGARRNPRNHGNKHKLKKSERKKPRAHTVNADA